MLMNNSFRSMMPMWIGFYANHYLFIVVSIYFRKLSEMEEKKQDEELLDLAQKDRDRCRVSSELFIRNVMWLFSETYRSYW